MSSNVFRYLGQTLAVWLRAFANRIEPKTESGADSPANSSTGDGPPAHWLERVRKHAPQLLHGARPAPRPARPARAPRADVTELSSPESVVPPGPMPAKPLSNWPGPGSRTAGTDESSRANFSTNKIRASSPHEPVPDPSSPSRLEPS